MYLKLTYNLIEFIRFLIEYKINISLAILFLMVERKELLISSLQSILH